MLRKLPVAIAIAILAVMLVPITHGNSTFIPDTVFKGSTLTGWHTLGSSNWKADNGELTGTGKPGGGWLVLDRSYQDVALHFFVKCAEDVKTGALLRAEKTADGGMKGIFVSLADGALSNYAVTLDSQGKELTRTPLRRVPGSSWVRVVPPADAGAAGPGGAGAGRGAPGGVQAGAAAAGVPGRGPGAAAGARGGFPAGGRGPAVPLPLTPPDYSFHPGEWNEMEIILDSQVLRSYLNRGREVTGVADDELGSYGPLALYVPPDAEVHFKEVGYKDLGIRTTQLDKVSPNFRMQKISDYYYAWTAAAGDFNKDGNLDLVAGPYIYYGPDFTKSRELFSATTLKPSTEFAYAHDNYVFDFNGDGWPDVLASPPAVTLYLNPKGESRRWQKYTVGNVTSEETVMGDIDGDGKPELIASANGTVGYYKFDPADPTKPWTWHAVSERGYGAPHGIGVGDINGDGRPDILNCYGWWENPGPGSKQETWIYHPEAFEWYSRGNPGGNRMWVWDVNGDGLNDVVTVMSSHDFGIAWFEQKRDKDGKISFVQHPIMSGEGQGATAAGGVVFSEAHGTAMGDVDGDGIPDLIVGKRYFTHLDSYLDPDPYGAPVLYWYKTVRDPKAPGGARFVPELIHNRSGAGSDILAVDLNKDGALDIVTSTNTGTYIFWGKPHAAAKTATTPAKAPTPAPVAKKQ